MIKIQRNEENEPFFFITACIHMSDEDADGENGDTRIKPLNLGHHTRALSEPAAPQSRDLETNGVKVGRAALHAGYLDRDPRVDCTLLPSHF